MVVTWMEGYIGHLESVYDFPRHLGGLAGMQLNNIRYSKSCSSKHMVMLLVVV